jgi:hypothetical protein
MAPIAIKPQIRWAGDGVELENLIFIIDEAPKVFSDASEI